MAPPRIAKRKAETPEEESAAVRPQRKRQKSGRRDQSSEPENEVAEPKTPTSSQLKRHLMGLYNEIHDATDHEGRLIATDFLKLPPRKRYPDYYLTIKKPIALDTILERIENDEYDDTEALKADLTLMTSNARKYNVKGSSIYEDATALQKIVKDYPSEIPQQLKVTLRQSLPKEKPAPPPPPKQTLQEAQGELLDYVSNYKEPRTKRLYSDIFMDAPSKKEYPEYYAFIERVICINDVKKSLKNNQYKNWGEFEADVNLIWSNAMAFNEDGSQNAFEKALEKKKQEVPDPVDQKKEQQHLKLKLNLQPPQPPSTKIKLHVPQKVATPPTPQAPSPPAPTPAPAPAAPSPAPPKAAPTPPAPEKNESPILAPQALPPKPAVPVRQGSPLKNQISPAPSKSPPSLRPAPPRTTSSTTSVPINKDVGIPLGEWARTPSVDSLRPRPALVARVGGSMPTTPNFPQGPVRTGVVVPQPNGTGPPGQNLMYGVKKERNLTLIPLVTITTAPVPEPVTTSPTSTPQSTYPGILLSITSPPPPAQSTQTLCLTVPRDIDNLTLSAHLTKDLTLHGSYTFTVTANGRRLSPTVFPDASRRSGTIDSIAVLPPRQSPTPPATLGSGTGDMWKFTIALGEKGSVTTIDASCTAFLKRDERGLLVRGERSRTGQAAGEDGGELERVVVLVLRGR